MAKIYNPSGRRRNNNEKQRQVGPSDSGDGVFKETVGTHFVNGKRVFENKKDNRGFVFNPTR